MKIKPCPFCLNKRVAIQTCLNGYVRVVCLLFRCQSEGPLRKYKAVAIRAWNKRLEGK